MRRLESSMSEVSSSLLVTSLRNVLKKCFLFSSKRLMPGPCSGKKFDINFGNKLYSKEKGQALLFSFEYNLLANLISNFNHYYMDRA